ncbi:tetratricopeptide repeat protein [Agaribacter flavus]|uniref:Tetratricopeptide repeat protein n=1 Tax=Agaribacter flavus TaxID=1902781 RepID=A0ABV7FJ86_9ALTE
MIKQFNKLLLTCSMLTAGVWSSSAFAVEPPVLCPGYVPAKTQLIGQSAGKKLTAAFEAYNQDNTPEAIRILKDIEAKEPFDQATVNKFLGQLLISEDDKEEEALKTLIASVDTKVLNDKDHADVLYLAAQLSLQLEKFEDSIAWYEKWMKFTCKEDSETYTRIGQAYTQMKQFAKVIEPADKAIALLEEPKKDPYVLKVSSYMEQKQFKNALDVAKTLVVLFPDDKQWWIMTGQFYMMLEDYTNALATLSAAYRQGFLTKKSDIKLLIQLYSAQDAPIQGARLYKKYLEEGLFEENEQELASLARTYHQAKEYKSAAQYYAKAAAKEPKPDYFQKQGELLLNAEDYKGSIAALNKALEAGIDSPTKVHFTLMQANFYAENFTKAYEHAKESSTDSSLRRNARAWMSHIKTKAKNRGINL